MTRIGMNPARNRISDYRPARVTVAVIVYLPHQTGYFQNRLDVVRLSFETLFENTQEPYDLLVFDNASCAEVKGYLQALQANGRIRYLLSSSENIGKLGALRVIAGAAPGELIAYADDDTFFYPEWSSMIISRTLAWSADHQNGPSLTMGFKATWKEVLLILSSRSHTANEFQCNGSESGQRHLEKMSTIM